MVGLDGVLLGELLSAKMTVGCVLLELAGSACIGSTIKESFLRCVLWCAGPDRAAGLAV